MKLRKEVYDRIKKNEKLTVYFTKKCKTTKKTLLREITDDVNKEQRRT